MSSRWSDAHAGFHPEIPNEARILDYLTGGKDHFAVDREFAEQALRIAPDLRAVALQSRRFLRRAVTALVDEGLRQFIDVGCGLPTQGSVDQILQKIAPGYRLVCVDNDPVVAAHAASVFGIGGPARILAADARDPDALMDDPIVTSTIKLDEPVGLVLHSILAVIPEDDVADHIVQGLLARVPSGSHLLLTHAISDLAPDTTARLAALYQEKKTVRGATTRSNLRTAAEVAEFVRDLELLPPGLVPLNQWRPDAAEREMEPRAVWALGGVGRKP
ncbi:SAM-dependent methyltransferase [Actinomadura madurae]|uniref:SAM-dependent methyltransferase n=1 Tax=Actinomadura madurae TaxID=1993 RepID=UPI0020D20CD6|nr:SAM-dependent methyltransferase [Actinomadura madurae]MCP9955256.1 SAM-dependent methyltransferase [Actinomadura madurae]MCP9971992.1 SAM-dependent methyltransferase [Actinomadura madurae]MCP9984495.1 SAM-dependent methyltransferase [Actinomadura madurae]MCQ0020688.1 SAM-dependent methyltransferase [Actinomadura madurae]